jgi:hypothetical protein
MIIFKNQLQIFGLATRKNFVILWRDSGGFTSSSLWRTERFNEIPDPESYFYTNWLQSYIYILCSNKSEDRLGVIDSTCITAGKYGIIGNYDVVKVETVFYKYMIDFAVINDGYDKRQFEDYWIWKVCYLASRAVIKERASDVKKHQQVNCFVFLRNIRVCGFTYFKC